MTEFSRRQQQPPEQKPIKCDHGKTYTEPCADCEAEWFTTGGAAEEMTLEQVALRAQRAADYCRANPGIAERYAALQIASINFAIAQLAKRVLEMRGPIQ